MDWVLVADNPNSRGISQLRKGISHELRWIGEATPADVEAVTRVTTEYYQSWFAGDGERIRACVHPALAKRTPETQGAEAMALQESPTEVLVSDTASGEGTGFDPKQDITVLNVFRDIATEMVRAEPFVEYLHLARFGSRWLIVNALYLELA